MTRQPAPPPLFRTRQRARQRGETIGEHHHDEAQLILALSGTTQVYTDTGRWLVPPPWLYQLWTAPKKSPLVLIRPSFTLNKYVNNV